VDLSGLIFVALAVVWAVVLIPMALRHHDEAAKTRAVDQFSDDLRVVARREAVTTSRSRLVVPPRARGPRDLPVPAPEATGTPQAPAEPIDASPRPDRTAARVARRAADRAAARAAARRRRIVLGVLLVTTVGVGVASFVGALQPWAPAVPGGLVLGFLVLARVMVKREHRAWLVEQQRAARWAEVTGSVEQQAASPAPVASTPGLAEDVDRRAHPSPSVVSGLDDTCAVPVGLTAEGSPVEGLWDPLPVTLPTYVTKPRAQRSVRTIDMLAPGVHSSGRNAADSALVAEAATAPPASQEPGRRAVGH
jgi:membrane protein YdbS with pleckstrin-like domain